MKKKSFILVSMREDYFHNKSELRIGIDIKLIDWIIRIGFNPLLVSDLKTLNYFISQRLINIRGIVLSGGDLNKNSARYKIEKRLVDISKKRGIPLLGICHGLQFINFVEGGSLKRVKNHVATNHKIKSITDYPQIVNSFHNYGINKLGKNLTIISRSNDGIIEAISHKNYKWLGWMWHPERDRIFNKKLIRIAKNFFTLN